MSRIKGLLFMVKRAGEHGKIGPFVDVAQIFETSPLREVYLERGYYNGAAEEWEAYMAEHQNPDAVAGDIDGDGDFDRKDKAVIRTANLANHPLVNE